MSRSFALVRFEDGTIYHVCYNGTVDVLSRFMITKKDLDEKYNGSIFEFNDFCVENYDKLYIDTDTITDAEPIEIYIDYGKGFMWKGMASKSRMYITTPISYEDNLDPNRYNIPEWVYSYHVEHGMSTKLLEGRIVSSNFKKSISC